MIVSSIRVWGGRSAGVLSGKPGEFGSRLVAEHRSRARSEHGGPQSAPAGYRTAEGRIDAGAQPLPVAPGKMPPDLTLAHARGHGLGIGDDAFLLVDDGRRLSVGDALGCPRFPLPRVEHGRHRG